jgi:hypothetical protein
MNGFIVLHDNAYLQVAYTAQDMPFSMHWMVLVHPPYNPDLSSSAFHVSGTFKKPLKGFQMKKTTLVQWLQLHPTEFSAQRVHWLLHP